MLARPFVSGSHLRESLGLRQERQMSFLRDECKHLVVVLGLSVDYSVTKRFSVALVGHMWECRDLLGIQETRDIIQENTGITWLTKTEQHRGVCISNHSFCFIC